jgi:hypothetical protein
VTAKGTPVAEDASRRRRVVIVEYDVTHLTTAQIDELLLRSLVGDQDVSLKIEAR